MSENNAVIETVDVDVKDLKPYKQNPRIGNIEAISESLQENKQYKPIVVNKKDNSILAGNHTWMAAKRLGWKKITVSYVDVDDEAATKIVLADNRTNDLATYDTSQLSELLKGINSPVGTGYTQQDVSLIVDAVDRSLTQTYESLTSSNADLDTYVEGLSNPTTPEIEEFSDLNLGDASIEGNKNDEDEDGFDDREDLHQSVENSPFLIDEGMVFLPTNNKWDIPELRRDMLLEKIPEPFDTWGGRDATPDDGITHWLWNYGTARPIGMPYDRAVMSFFSYDDKFMNFLTHTNFMVTKVLHAGIRRAVVPDFSYYFNDPKAFHLTAAYQAHWLGRLFQEVGMKVIPRIQFVDEESLEFCMLGIPKNPPLLIMSLQSLDPEEGNPKKDTKEKAKAVYAKCIDIALDHIQPEHFIVYAGNPGHNLVRDVVKPDMPVTYLDNYAKKRRGVVFDKKEQEKNPEAYDPLIEGTKPKHIAQEDEEQGRD